MIYTLLSLGLLMAGIIIVRRKNKGAPRTTLNGLGYIVGAMSIMVWPASHSAVIDAVSRTPGLGRLLNDICATLAAMLQFGFITNLATAWSRWRKIAVVVYSALLTLFAGIWLALHVALGQDLGRFLYAGYATNSLPVRIWNTVVGLTIVYVCVLAFIGYTRANGKIHNRYPRLTTAVGASVWATFTLYGVLINVQLAAVWLVPFAGNGSARSVSVSRSHHARCSVPNMRRNFQLAVLVPFAGNGSASSVSRFEESSRTL